MDATVNVHVPDRRLKEEQRERTRNLNDQLRQLLDEFSFDSVHAVMKKLGVTQYNPFTRNVGVPTAMELRDHGERLLRQVATMEGEAAETHSCWLSAYRFGNSRYRLACELERADTKDLLEEETTYEAY